MALTGRTVIGVFDEAGNADRAIDALQNAGFSSADIHRSGRGDSAGGGFWTGLKSFFTGDDTGTGTGAHVADDLTNMGVSDDEAQYYDNEYDNGRTIVAVNAGDRAEDAKMIMNSSGAYNYANRRSGGTTTANTYSTTSGTPDTGYADAATTGYTAGTADTTTTDYDTTRNRNSITDTTATDTTNYDRTRDANYTDTANTTGYTNDTDEQRIRLREEQLNVTKQSVQTGEVGLHKEVVSQQQTVNVPVTHEEVYIENRPVTDATVDDNTPIGEGETIRVPVTDEKVNVSKDTVVTGEVSIGKRAVQEDQQVTDTVRREELRTDTDGNPRVVGDTTNTYNTTGTDRTDTGYNTMGTDRTDTNYDNTDARNSL